MSERITSLQNPQVKLWRGLNKSRAARLEAGLFLAEGEHMAGEAVKEHKVRALLIDEKAQEKYCALAENAKGASVYYLAGHVMAALCDAKTPQGIAAVCDYPKEAATLPENAPLLVALDGVQDPGNVGTVIRTMDAAGYSCLLMDDKTADPYSPKALRASMGGVFRIPMRRYSDLAGQLCSLAQVGYDIVAGDLRGEPFYQRRKAKDRLCVVIGNEGQGVSPAVLAQCTLRLKLPMVGGAESLNAAVAGAIMMYDFIRERAGQP